jgi:hypothetical protein
MKAAAFAGALAGCGMIGFVSAGGYVRWIFAAGGDMSRAGAYAFGVFLVALLLWKTTWSAVRAIKPSCLAWYEIIAPFICVLFALGVLWTGTLTGGVVPGSSDAVTGSLMNHFFGAADEAAEFFVTASGLHWGALVVAIVVAYMTTARQQDAWSRLCGSFPRFARFVTTGYGVDFVFSRFLTGLNWFGSVLYRFIDVNAWDRWMPAVVRWISRRVIFPVARVSEIIVFVLDVGVRKLVELPAKVLQLVQSGDVQWYLFFAVDSGIAILIHFLRF